jgi:hypothetical protein
MGFQWLFKSVRFVVMPGLVPGIHVCAVRHAVKTWMAGTSPTMTAS